MAALVPKNHCNTTITSLKHFGRISKCVSVGDIGCIEEQYQFNYALVVSTDFRSETINNENSKASLTEAVFLLVDDRVLDDEQRIVGDEQLREHQRHWRTYAESQYNTKFHTAYVGQDLIKNALDEGQENKSGGASNKTEEIIDKMLIDGHNGKVSDIHIRCSDRAGETQIKFRIDGELDLYGHERNQQSIADLASVLYGSLAADEGQVAGLTFDSQKKLDGVLYRTVNNMRLGARIASHPTEKKKNNFLMVLRLLGDQDAVAERIAFSKLGFRFNQETDVVAALNGKGIVLVIGETNSGKSVSMQNMLMEINESTNFTRNIISVENPVERQILGVQQLSLIESGAMTKEGLTDAFQAVKEFIVRADPDDVAVGEIRDKLTCDTSIQLALTGHNVMATMHCDSPFDVPERMIGLGADAKQLMSGNSLKSVVSQKLFKKLCPHCALTVYHLKSLTPSQTSAISAFAKMGLADQLDKIKFRNHVGCKKCNHRGIKERQLVAEVVRFDEAMTLALLEGRKEHAIKNWLILGGLSRQDIAISYVREGAIDPTDVLNQLGALTETFDLRAKYNIAQPSEIYL